MDIFRSKGSSTHQTLDSGDRPAKRISTPAGQRLSMIIESTQARRSKAPAAKINVTTTSTYCNDPEHLHVHPAHRAPKESKKLGVVSVLGGKLSTPRESSDEPTPNGSALSVSVWSEKDGTKFGHIRNTKKRGFLAGWSRKRIAIVVAVLLALIIALAVGLAVGLKKKPASRYGFLSWCSSVVLSLTTRTAVRPLPRPPPALHPQITKAAQPHLLAPKPTHLPHQRPPSHPPPSRPASLSAPSRS
jgi:hypothetical protein